MCGILFIFQLSLCGLGEQSLVLELAVIFADQIVVWLANYFSMTFVGELYDKSMTYSYFLKHLCREGTCFIWDKQLVVIEKFPV